MSTGGTLLIAGAAVVASLAAVATVPSIASASTGLSCDIDSRQRNGALVIEGSAVATQSGPASYRFSVRGSGSGGSSDIAQSGDVGLRSGERASVGNVVLRGGDNVTVRLEVTSRGETVSCRKRIDW